MQFLRKWQGLFALAAIFLFLRGSAVFASARDESALDSISSPDTMLIKQLTGSSVLHGVDVSSWQYTIDWDALKASTDFVFIRSSYGAYSVDSYFARNQSEARRVGLLTGYYHYSYPQYNSALAEADHFVDVVGALKPGECLCLDFEENYSDPVNWSRTFLNRVYARTGVRPLIYINYWLETSYNWSPVISDDYGLWLADWDGIANFTSPTGLQWPFMAFKQYSDSGSVGGINPVDLDVFNGGRTQFLAYGLQSAPPVVAITSPSSSPYTTSNSSTGIAGTVTDAAAVTGVTWSNDRGGSGTCIGTNSWSVSGIALQPGTNVITITAYDYMGHKGTAIQTVEYALPTISGSVILQDYKGGASMPVSIELRKSGGSTTSVVVTPDSEGRFVLQDIVPGTYDLAFKASHWLQNVVHGVQVSGNVQGICVSLPNGDVNGDNSTNMGDYVSMKTAWGATPQSGNWNANADLNGDACVNMGDYTILKKNWGSLGDH